MNSRRLKRIAIKAGIKASKRRHHLVTPEELGSLKVQVLPMWPRVLICIAGLAMLVLAIWGGMDHFWGRVALGATGTGTTTFSIFGVRRTLESIPEFVGEVLINGIIEGIGSAIGGIFDF